MIVIGHYCNICGIWYKYNISLQKHFNVNLLARSQGSSSLSGKTFSSTIAAANTKVTAIYIHFMNDSIAAKLKSTGDEDVHKINS